MEEAAQQAAHVHRQLAAHQVERLDAVGALVDLGDAAVAHQLLHAVVADIAVAAQTCTARLVVSKPRSVNIAFTTGVISATKSSASARAAGSGCFAARSSSIATQPASARAPSMKARMVSSMRRTSGWTMIGIGRLLGEFRAGDRAALQALAA